MRTVACILVTLLILPAGIAGSAAQDLPRAAALAAEAAAACEVLVDVPGQGPSCPASGGWYVPLKDGTVLFTHGPDRVLPEPLVAVPEELPMLPPASPLSATVLEPVCAPASEPGVQVIYALPPATLDQWTIRERDIRAGVMNADRIVQQEALRFGIDVRLKFRCDDEGRVHIARETLATARTAATFSTMVDDLRDLGYTSATTKFWIAYEGGVAGGYAGQGNVWGDDRPGVENENNQGDMYAITYLSAAITTLGRTLLHEAGHTMGAVQLSAPQSTGAYHCTDGIDIMCYNDGGPQADGYTSRACPRAFVRGGPEMPFDCNNDDYFHPQPAPGSYLDTHWNLGSPNNLFVQWKPVGI